MSGPLLLEGISDVVVRHVQIGFGSLIWFLVKCMSALTIAVLILAGIGFAAVFALGDYGCWLTDVLLQYLGPYLP